VETKKETIWLSKWERTGLAIFFVVMVLFGSLVVKRSAFMQRRMTDLDCYLRAAWAVRTGADLYEIKDPNDWHYNYPPLFAILMVPLADPPDGEDRSGMLPFWLSAAVWYGFSLVCLALAVHWLAGAIETRMKDEGGRMNKRTENRSSFILHPSSFSKSWWALRILPVLACLAPIGHTLVRGQVNLLLLALLCGTIAATVRGRSWLAGFCLAGAICLKVIPAFLLLFPLWRRDFRCLGGCALGLVIGLGMLPFAVFGGPRTVAYYQKYTSVLLGPAMGIGSDQSRAKEMIETTCNDSQSLQATLHNTLHPVRAERPAHPTVLVRWIPRLVGGLMTLLTLLAAGPPTHPSPTWGRAGWGGLNTVLFLGALVINMVLLSPICHMHYFSLCVIVVMGLVVAAWQRNGGTRLGFGLILLLAVNFIVYLLPNVPGWLVLRDLGIAMYPVLVLWIVGTVVLWKRRRTQQARAVDWQAMTTRAAYSNKSKDRRDLRWFPANR
jgi:hypothetical protein